MAKRKSIYKTEAGRESMAKWYTHFTERLGSERVSFEQVETRFGTTNVLIAGDPDAPPLWCFHGAMASAPAALAQVPGLLDRFRIYFPDTVGQPGRSDESRLDWQGPEHGYWVQDILDAFELESVTALGVSLGGYVVLRAAQVAPTRISRAGLWAPGGVIKPSAWNMFSLMGSALAYAIAPSTPRLERVLSRTFTDLDDDYVRFFGDSLEHVHPDRRFPAVLPLGSLDAWKAPVMLVTHERDTVFPADALDARADLLIPNIKKKARADAKHMPPFAKADLDPILNPLMDFLTP